MPKMIENQTEHSLETCTQSLTALDDALYVLGGKWKLRIIIALREGTVNRFNELQRTIDGISAKMLSSELKQLELNGFVKRRVHADHMPVLVEYELTEYCDTLEDVLGSLIAWGKMHREKVKNLS